MRYIQLSMILLMALGLAMVGCDKTTDEAPEATVEADTPAEDNEDVVEDVVVVSTINSDCPYHGGGEFDPADPPSVVAFEDVKVGFCADGCKTHWDEATDPQRAELVARLQAQADVAD